MQTLVYASRHAIAAGDLEHEVGVIISTSIRNNRSTGLTGLLLFHDGYFLQALEGPAQAVSATYRRILNDPRHHESKILLSEQILVRAFPDWNMCARRITPADDAILDTLARRQSFDPYGFTGEAAMRLLTAVRDIQGRTQLQALA